jgi:hypothetical protein
MATLTPTAFDPQPQVIERSAMQVSTSWDPVARSVRLVLSTETEVGDGFVLLHSSNALIDPERPVPAILDHNRQAESVWGYVKDLRFEVVKGVMALTGTAVLDGAQEAMALAEPRLRNGSARFSIGARLREFAYPEMGASDVINVTRWSLGELSLVIEGMDPRAIQFAHNPTASTPMTVQNQAGGDPAGNSPAPAGTAPVAVPSTAPAPPPLAPVGDALERAALKRERDILQSCSAAGLDYEATRAYVDGGKPWAEVVDQIIRAKASATVAPTAGTGPVSPVVTSDAGDKLNRSIESYMLYRAGTVTKLEDSARPFIGYSMRDIAREFLNARGINTRGESINKIVDRAFHTSSDFPLLVANVANKSLIAGYAEEPQTWRPLARQKNLPNFKPASEVQVQGNIILQELGEQGEYANATLVEGAATWRIASYGRRIPVGRNLIINDDLDALGSVPEKAGRGARLTENNIVWELLTLSPNGSTTSLDNQALFVAGHNNTGAGAITIAGLDTGVTAMSQQLDIAGNSLNIEAAYLIVPPQLATVAAQIVQGTSYAPAAATGNAGPNPFIGRFQIIKENRLSARSATQWYLAANPGAIDMIRFGYLDGQEGPEITLTEKRNPDGLELLVREDFGAHVMDFRGFYRSTGV